VALDVEVGSPLIGLTRTIFAEGDLGVEHLNALYRPDRYTLRMELERKVSSGVRRWSAVLPQPANEERPARQAKSLGVEGG
jgi:GntR family transcriptional regulator